MRIKQKVTIQDIAKKAGVSACTVSRAFNKHPYVKEDVSRKVLEASRKLNYTPKFAAVEEKIAILVNSLNSFSKPGYENALSTAIMKRTLELGYGIEIVSIAESRYHFERFVKGAISLVYSPETTKIITEKTGTPIVTINNLIPGFSHVCSDHRNGSVKAVDYLVSKGHSKIGFVINNLVNWGDIERVEGFKKGLEKNNIDFDEDLVFINMPRRNMFEVIAKLMKHKPTAIFVAGENLGLEAAHSLNLLNFKIPEDVSLLSFENAWVSYLLNPAQTTIDQGLPVIGEKAVDLLVDIIKTGKNKHENIVLPNKLIERDSVKRLS
jgi:LacI family transcriptional regulator, galactose operon repressor